VATSVGGVPEMVADGESALLAPARDSAALARAIRAALDAPDVADRLRRRAKDDVERRFTLDRRLRELRGIYEAVTATRGRLPK
jgi:glycosyltransferase involved in cell wall biosynthesis